MRHRETNFCSTVLVRISKDNDSRELTSYRLQKHIDKWNRAQKRGRERLKNHRKSRYTVIIEDFRMSLAEVRKCVWTVPGKLTGALGDGRDSRLARARDVLYDWKRASGGWANNERARGRMSSGHCWRWQCSWNCRRTKRSYDDAAGERANERIERPGPAWTQASGPSTSSPQAQARLFSPAFDSSFVFLHVLLPPEEMVKGRVRGHTKKPNYKNRREVLARRR